MPRRRSQGAKARPCSVLDAALDNWIITVQFDIGAPEEIELGTGKLKYYCLDWLFVSYKFGN
jgi:hypothetical protein